VMQLTKRMVEKPWGKEVLPAPFIAPEGRRIGEVWFEPPAELPDILVKYIFTSETLSVQVHPSDAQAAALAESDRGKEECWLVIDAEPGATLGVGFKQEIGSEDMRRAALDGTIEDLMTWYPVAAGDFFYIPAGTVHAIGAGVSLIEIQQNSDITYRLYDYGRPRELHLDKGIEVAKGVPLDDSRHRSVSRNGTVQLVDGPYFMMHRLDGQPDKNLLAAYGGPSLVIPRAAPVMIGSDLLVPGDCGLVNGLRGTQFPDEGATLLVRALA